MNRVAEETEQQSAREIEMQPMGVHRLRLARAARLIRANNHNNNLNQNLSSERAEAPAETAAATVREVDFDAPTDMHSSYVPYYHLMLPYPSKQRLGGCSQRRGAGEV